MRPLLALLGVVGALLPPCDDGHDVALRFEGVASSTSAYRVFLQPPPTCALRTVGFLTTNMQGCSPYALDTTRSHVNASDAFFAGALDGDLSSLILRSTQGLDLSETSATPLYVELDASASTTCTFQAAHGDSGVYTGADTPFRVVDTLVSPPPASPPPASPPPLSPPECPEARGTVVFTKRNNWAYVPVREPSTCEAVFAGVNTSGLTIYGAAQCKGNQNGIGFRTQQGLLRPYQGYLLVDALQDDTIEVHFGSP